MALVTPPCSEIERPRKSAMIQKNPLMLKDYLMDDLSSCSSSGFKSFPRRQCCTTIRFLLEIDLKSSSRPQLPPPQSIDHSHNNFKNQKPKQLLRRSRSRAAASNTLSALQRASGSVINAVRNLQFHSVKSTSSSVQGGLVLLLPRSISRRLWRKSFRTKVEEEEKDIVKWRSFRELLQEQDKPSDQTTASTKSTDSKTNSNSWGESEFSLTSESSIGNYVAEGKNSLPENKKVGGRVGVTAGEDSIETPTTTTTSICSPQNAKEYVYNRLQFSYGWYFTFVQGFVYLGLIYLQGFTTQKMVNPWKTYVKLSAVLMGSHGLTKGSLAWLNYPAQIMFKSTKVLPVMVMGAFVPGLRRKYPIHEYISAILLVIGLIIFTLADANTSPNFSILGVVMISGALIMDAFLGNVQEAIFTMNPDTTQTEMLFCSTVVGLPMLLPPMILTGELFRAWNSCAEHPYVYGVLVFEAIATFVGQVSVLSLIALFGAATTAMVTLLLISFLVLNFLSQHTLEKNIHKFYNCNWWSGVKLTIDSGIVQVTTARKAVTLLLSYIIFTKPMTEEHGTGLLLIAMGIILKMVPENQVNKHAKSFKEVLMNVPEANDTEEDEENKALV